MRSSRRRGSLSRIFAAAISKSLKAVWVKAPRPLQSPRARCPARWNVLRRFCHGAQFGYARIHVEDINPSVLLTDLLEQRIKLARFGDIGSDRDTIGADLLLSVAHGPRTAPGHDDFGAFLDELFRCCETDPASAQAQSDDPAHRSPTEAGRKD